MVNEKGFEMKGHPPYCASKNVGPQGVGGKPVGSGEVAGVSKQSGGITPKKVGTVPLDGLLSPQNGVMPKVGE